jgi:hypothetical protein
MNAFRVLVKSVGEAKKILLVLAEYDEFQLKHNIKPDYSNVQGLEEFDGEDWLEWEDEDGNNVDYTEEEGNEVVN